MSCTALVVRQAGQIAHGRSFDFMQPASFIAKYPVGKLSRYREADSFTDSGGFREDNGFLGKVLVLARHNEIGLDSAGWENVLGMIRASPDLNPFLAADWSCTAFLELGMAAWGRQNWRQARARR